MTDRIEKTAKTVEDAVSEALKSLNATREEVEVTIVDAGSKGVVFGLGSRPAKVVVERVFSPQDTVARFLREVTSAMGLSVQVDTNLKDKHVYINLIGENMGVLIGKRGQTLDSLQYLANLIANRCGVPEISVILDTENYRRRRKETLEALAVSLAKKVKATRKSVVLEPMSRYERHVIHTVLQHDRQIKTYSEGDEPYRNVVIAPK